MSEREIRIAMLPKWKAVQEAFIRATGGAIGPTSEEYPDAFAARERAEEALRREYFERVRQAS